MARLPLILIASATVAVAGITAAQVATRADQAIVANRPLDRLSAQEMRQRFPARPQPGPAIRFRPRPGGVANWRRPSPPVLNQEAITVAKIAAAFKKLAAGKAVGFSVTVMGPTGASSSVAGGSARRSPDDAPRAMSDKERISIASVSKTITAATLLRVLAWKKKSLDDKAYLHLPSDWTFSPSFKTVTIRQLLGHASGISDSKCNIGFAALKACAAKPVNAKNWEYANTNYALMRVMLSKLYGLPATTASDFASNYVTIVNRQTFNSAGLPFETCISPQPKPALSYKSDKDNGSTTGFFAPNFDWTTVVPGQDWGDMTQVCGSQGWNLSSRELARFMHALMLTEKILPQTKVDEMRTGGLGLFWSDFGPGLGAYGHGGWHPAGWNQGEVNTVILTFSNDITVGAIINSRYNGNLGGDLAAAVKSVLPAPTL